MKFATVLATLAFAVVTHANQPAATTAPATAPAATTEAAATTPAAPAAEGKAAKKAAKKAKKKAHGAEATEAAAPAPTEGAKH